MQELRVAMRVLVKSPWFSISAISFIALAVGLNTALFSVLHAVAFRPLLYREADRIVAVGSLENGREFAPLTPANFHDLREAVESFDGATGYRYNELELTGVGAAERVTALHVLDGFFEFLSVPPRLGRTLGPSDFHSAPNAEDGLWTVGDAAVLDYGFFRRVYGADERAVGRTLRLNDKDVVIVGVMPEGFEAFWGETDVYVPWILPPGFWSVRPPHVLPMLARLRPGVSLEQAGAEVDTVYARLAHEFPETNSVLSGNVRPARAYLFGQTTRSVAMLFLGAVLVLLVACANLAGLMATRFRTRVRDVAVRRALGASSLRITRQLTLESAVLAISGGLVGLVTASFAVRWLPVSPALPFPAEVDATVVGFSLLLLAVTALVLGLLPGWMVSGADLAGTLRGLARGMSSKSLAGGFVVVQIAIALGLSDASSSLFRSFLTLQNRPLGFAPSQVATFYVTLPESRYPDVESQRLFRRRAIEELTSIPGVVSVGSSSHVPLTPMQLHLATAIEGRPMPRGTNRAAPVFVSADTLATLKIPVIRGRTFQDGDSKDSPWVIVVNDRMARDFWPAENPIGKRIRLEYPWIRAPLTVVGVASDVVQEGVNRAIQPAFYILHEQFPQEWMYFAIRSGEDPAAVVAAARARIGTIDPHLPVTDVATMEERVDRALSDSRSRAELVSVYAIFGLILSNLGLYVTLVSSVGQRSKELVIRMTLGATRQQVARLAASDGIKILAIGGGVGVASALLVRRFASSFWLGVETETSSLALAFSLMVVLGIAAIAIPAVRVARLDLSSRLRQD